MNMLKETVELIRKELEESGVKVWTNPAHPVFKHVQACLPGQTIGAIKVGKGLDRISFVIMDGAMSFHCATPLSCIGFPRK